MHGKGKRTLANGNVKITRFEAGREVGQGAQWSADRAQARELKQPKQPKQDGEEGRSISLEEAAQIAARVGLPVP